MVPMHPVYKEGLSGQRKQKIWKPFECDVIVLSKGGGGFSKACRIPLKEHGDLDAEALGSGGLAAAEENPYSPISLSS